MFAKARLAVVVSIPLHDDEHAVYANLPHTTALRGGRFEVQVSLRWPQSGASDVEGMRNIPASVLLGRLGALEPAQMEAILRATKT